MEETFEKEPVLLKAPPYWHNTGDIIIQIKNDKAKYELCVHQNILSWHSLIWKDMFELGRDSAENRTMEDELPVVSLEDPLRDICALIWSFYNGLHEFYGDAPLKEILGLSKLANVPETSDLDITLGLLKSSHKYQADKIHQMVITLLLECWPLHYAAYFAIEFRPRLAGSVDLIRAARLTNCAALLPSAFYELAIIPMEQWTDDGLNKLSLLSAHDLRCLFVGKGRILQRYQVFIQDLLKQYPGDEYRLHSSGHRCCNRRKLLLKLEGVLGAIFLDSVPDLEKTSILKSLADLGQTKNCDECGNWMIGLLRALEMEIWKNMPLYFNLPPVKSKYTVTRARRALGV